MNKSDKTIAGHFFRLSNKLIFLEKKFTLAYDDIQLYPSEIHLLNVVSDCADINAKEMAKRLGVYGICEFVEKIGAWLAIKRKAGKSLFFSGWYLCYLFFNQG